VAEYYPMESVQELAGGGLRVTMRVADPRWVSRLVLRLGGAGKIITPPELAQDAMAAAAMALAAYGTA
jgi:proteasome accessory factor C